MPRAGVGGVVRRAGRRVWHREPVAAWDLLNGRRAPLPSGAVRMARRHAYIIQPAGLVIYGDGCCWSGCLSFVEVAPSPLFFFVLRVQLPDASGQSVLTMATSPPAAVHWCGVVAVCDSSLTRDEDPPVDWSVRLCGETPRVDFRCKEQARSRPVLFLVRLLYFYPPDLKSRIVCVHDSDEVPAENRTPPTRRRTYAAVRVPRASLKPDVVRGGALPPTTTRTVDGDPNFHTLVGGGQGASLCQRRRTREIFCQWPLAESRERKRSPIILSRL